MNNLITGSFSSILKVILLTVSPTLLKSLITPAPLNADVLVAFGSSQSTTRLHGIAELIIIKNTIINNNTLF